MHIFQWITLTLFSLCHQLGPRLFLALCIIVLLCVIRIVQILGLLELLMKFGYYCSNSGFRTIVSHLMDMLEGAGNFPSSECQLLCYYCLLMMMEIGIGVTICAGFDVCIIIQDIYYLVFWHLDARCIMSAQNITRFCQGNIHLLYCNCDNFFDSLITALRLMPFSEDTPQTAPKYIIICLITSSEKCSFIFVCLGSFQLHQLEIQILLHKKQQSMGQ